MALIRTGGSAVKKIAAFTGYNEGTAYHFYGVDNSGNNYSGSASASAFTITGLASFGAGTSSRVVTALVPLTVYVGDRAGTSGATQHLNTSETYTFTFGTKTLLLVED